MTVRNILLVSALALSSASCGLKTFLKNAPPPTDENKSHSIQGQPDQTPSANEEAKEPRVFTDSVEKIALSKWSSIPNCNGFKYTFNKKESALVIESCSDTTESTFGSYNSVVRLPLDEKQTADVGKIFSKLKAVRQKSAECPAGGSSGIVRVTLAGKDTTYDVGSPCAVGSEPSAESLSILSNNYSEVLAEFSQYVNSLKPGSIQAGSSDANKDGAPR